MSLSEVVSNLTPPVLGPLEAVGEGLVVEEGLVDLLLGVENEGTVLDNGLIQRQTGNDDYLC